MLPLEASFFCFSFDFLISLSFFGRDVFFGERRGIFAVLRPVKTVGLVGCRRDGVDVLARSVHGHTVLFFKSFQVSVVTTLSKVLTVSASDCEISSSRSFLYTMHHHLRHRNWAFHDLWLGTSTVLSTICVKICGTRMAISSTCGLAAGTTSSSCCSPFVAFSVSRVFPAIRLSIVVHLLCITRRFFSRLFSAGANCSSVVTSSPRPVQSGSVSSSGIHNRLSSDEPPCSTHGIRNTVTCVICDLQMLAPSRSP